MTCCIWKYFRYMHCSNLQAWEHAPYLFIFPHWIHFHSFHPLLQFNDLQECYLQKRRQMANQPHIKQESDKNIIHREGYNAGLADFQSVLTTFTQYRYKSWSSFRDFSLLFVLLWFYFHNMYFVCFSRLWNSRLRVIAELRHGDIFHSANIVSRWVKSFLFQYLLSFWCNLFSFSPHLCMLYIQ